MRAVTTALAGALLVSACGPGDEVAARRARLEVQRVHLVSSLERLEARLLAGQGRVRAWEELRSRHAGVSAVACEVNGRHVADMARLEVEERWLAAAARTPRLATAVPAATLGRGGGVPLDPAGAGSAPSPAPGPAASTPPATVDAVPGSGGG